MENKRTDRTFSSDDDTCAAWLYPAANEAAVTPIVVMAHGLSGRPGVLRATRLARTRPMRSNRGGCRPTPTSRWA